MSIDPLRKGRASRGPNPTGKNGVDNGTWPENDEELRATLLNMAKQQLKIEERIDLLGRKHGLFIKRSRFFVLQKEYDIPSVRRTKYAPEVAQQLVMDKMSDAHDTGQSHGVAWTKNKLASDLTFIPRQTIRDVKRLNEPDAVEARFPGSRRKKHYGKLTGIGPFYEINCDGHEKLNTLALQMGSVGLPIYGMKDKWTRAFVHLCVVPNDRLETTIGHVYLDFVEMYKAIPIQITVDKGSETGYMQSFQVYLREKYAPDLDKDTVPAFVALTSTNNIPIEGGWHQLRKAIGHTMKAHIARGKTEGLFNPNSDTHAYVQNQLTCIDPATDITSSPGCSSKLFNWLWPPIIQRELDKFRDEWNMHQIRKQPNALLPTGSTPTQFFTAPDAYGGEYAFVPIPQEAIDELRQMIPISRDKAFEWVDDEFACTAETVWIELGQPECTLLSGWNIFMQMIEPLRAYYEYEYEQE